jgi:hypothetical protein
MLVQTLLVFAGQQLVCPLLVVLARTLPQAICVALLLVSSGASSHHHSQFFMLVSAITPTCGQMHLPGRGALRTNYS